MKYSILRNLVKEDFDEVLRLIDVYRMPHIIEATVPDSVYDKILNSTDFKLSNIIRVVVGGNNYAEFGLSGHIFKIKAYERFDAKYRNRVKRNPLTQDDYDFLNNFM